MAKMCLKQAREHYRACETCYENMFSYENEQPVAASSIEQSAISRSTKIPTVELRSIMKKFCVNDE